MVGFRRGGSGGRGTGKCNELGCLLCQADAEKEVLRFRFRLIAISPHCGAKPPYALMRVPSPWCKLVQV